MTLPKRESNDDDLKDTILPRPDWMKWYYARWSDSTNLMDAEQKGWYMNLLMYAASQGEPAGYLPDDENELKAIANFKETGELNADAVRVLSESATGAVLVEEIKEIRNKKWSRVRSKFRVSKDYEGLLYNRTLLLTLQEAYKKRKFASRAAQAMHSKRLETNTLVAPALQKPKNAAAKGVEMHSGRTAGALSNEIKDINTQKNTVSKNNTVQKKSAETLEEPTEFVLHSPEEELEKKGPKKESRFKEERFNITPQMYVHLREKYSEFVQGDFDYLVENFKIVYFEKSTISWKLTFYKFVSNQLVKYGYKPGDFNWRERSNGKSNTSRFETTADYHARLQREQDESINRVLHGSSETDNRESEESLPLTPDDVRST